MSAPLRGLLRALRHLQPLVTSPEPGISILAYHLVGAGSDSPVDLSTGRFERQVAELRDHAKVISMDDVVRLLRSKERLDGPAVAVTFDDAYANFYAKAWPILERYGLPATLFVPLDFVDGRGAPPIAGTETLPPLSRTQLETLASEPLCTLGSHGKSHVDLRRLGEAVLREEIEGSKRELEERLGIEVRSFCYPRALSSPRVERLVEGTYDIGLAAGGRQVRPTSWRPGYTPRLPIRRDMPESLLPMLRSPVWIEEAVAHTLRRWRRRAA